VGPFQVLPPQRDQRHLPHLWPLLPPASRRPVSCSYPRCSAARCEDVGHHLPAERHDATSRSVCGGVVADPLTTDSRVRGYRPGSKVPPAARDGRP